MRFLSKCVFLRSHFSSYTDVLNTWVGLLLYQQFERQDPQRKEKQKNSPYTFLTSNYPKTLASGFNPGSFLFIDVIGKLFPLILSKQIFTL
jgi:hypothetical protein